MTRQNTLPMMHYIVDSLHTALLTIMVATGFFFAEIYSTVVDTVGGGGDHDWFDMILGPFGALVLCLLGIYVLVKYLKEAREKNDVLQGKLDEEKDSQIEDLKKINEELRRKIEGGN